jgi:uncharacterized SAM-binding protein YcdF (DUF218 family)
MYVADLYRQGYAKRILVSRPYVNDVWRSVSDLGVSVKSLEQIYLEILNIKGVPEQAIQVFGDANLSTYDEALALHRLLGDREVSLLVVTTDYHSRRAKTVLHDVLPNARVMVVATPYYRTPENWWQDYDAARHVVLELVKTGYYLVGGRFRSN